MVNNKKWLSLRHFVTKEYLNNIYMGQQAYGICNTDLKTNGLLEDLDECTIFASTLPRSTQTVEYILSEFKNINFNVKFSDNLIERGLGDFEGKQKSIIRKDAHFFRNEKFIIERTPPNGEPFERFCSRVSEEVEFMKNEFKYKNILVVSHLQVLRMIRFCMLDYHNFTEWHNINYKHGEIVRECYGE